MLRVHVKDYLDGNHAVMKTIFKDAPSPLPYRDGIYLVQMLVGENDITALLVVMNQVWRFVTNWWNNEEDIIIEAVARVEEIDITGSFEFCPEQTEVVPLDDLYETSGTTGDEHRTTE